MSDENPRRWEVDGIYQGDTVTNTRTGETGTVTFACPEDHESHVRVRPGRDADAVQIWPHAEVRRTG